VLVFFGCRPTGTTNQSSFIGVTERNGQYIYTVSQKNDNDVAHYNFNAH